MLGYSVSTYDREEPYDMEGEWQQLVEDTKEKIEKGWAMISDAFSDWDFENNTNLLDRYVMGENVQELLKEIE